MSTPIQIDLDVAMQQFKKRKEENKGKKIDNSSLPAGSPIYIYCRFCDKLIYTLPESYTCTPNNICNPCQILHNHGLI